MRKLWFGLAAAAAVLAGATACDEVKGEIDEATGEGPQTSYCEALCTKAVECAQDERPVADAAAMTAQCLTETRASDPACADAESSPGLNPAESEALTSCTDDVEALPCTGFTGSIDEIKTATTPASCGTQGTTAVDTYTSAREAATETNEQLCDRRSTSFCGRMTSCLEEKFGGTIPQDVLEAVGLEPQAQCVSALGPVATSCKTETLYQPEADLTSVNTARQGARNCLAGIAASNCDVIFAGDYTQLPPECGASFAAAEDMLDFAQLILGVAQPYLDRVPPP